MASVQKSYIEQINEIAHLLPTPVLQDINRRITDWLAGGGSLEDNYIKQATQICGECFRSNEKQEDLSNE